jgi:hypothetical protein
MKQGKADFVTDLVFPSFVVRNDMYVVVSARLNNFNNRISLLALDIRPITDYNEITFHLLDAVYNHVKLKNKVELKRRGEEGD